MAASIPIVFISKEQLSAESDHHRSWFAATGFQAEAGSYSLVPNADGTLASVYVGHSDALDTWTVGQLAVGLPANHYYLPDSLTDEDATKLYLGWRLSQYQFTRYKQDSNTSTARPKQATLEPPKQADLAYVEAAVEATYLVRDLVNTPAGDMGPAQLEERARAIATTYNAEIQVTTGEALLTENYPMIHAVGRASDQAPRLIDMQWGDRTHPRITLVGKGVCFDSGGLDIKNATGMKLMKKDMGGAAHVLGIATLVMKLNLPVRLRVLVPAVENSIAGNAMHPLDILNTRKGITVEVGNTDAEGRLVLGDALWEASQEHPQLLVDFATLTGAARVALGTELPAMFCSDETTALQLKQAGLQVDDPLWPMPLHLPYRSMLDSAIADISNISNGSYGGAITAALFLNEFVMPDIPWVHIDVMAWNLRSLPGRPEGGEAMGVRAVTELIRQIATGT
ncbi:MAG: leucyl aminopeptidase family protein [Leptolyngbyaceae bacterium]|nr:leucyl aminopeptidase family protein [Leptolyngbyaceae bacterium]